MKTTEDAAREYTDKIASKSGECPWEWDDVENSFIAGDAHGYARAVDEASEGFEEFIKNVHVYYPKQWEEIKEAWAASRLSAQKEIDELENKLKTAVECLGRLEKITVLPESVKYTIKEAFAKIRGEK